jgi:multisubunit Na+/H+ antiporter MnhF subunit
MNPWLLGTIALLGAGLAPAVWIGSRGEPQDRLVGLELGGVVATLAMMSFAQAVGQSSYLIVPLVLALVSVAGILVYTRLLAPRR